MENKKLVISNETGRLDKILGEQFTHFSRSQFGILFKDGKIFVNDKNVKPSYKVSPNDVVTFGIPKPKVEERVPEPNYDLPLEILFEDQDIIVVNKPEDMVVHPAVGHEEDTLVNALLAHTKDLATGSHITRPGIVHRLDKDTSGVLMVAKSDLAYEKLVEQLKEKTNKREYLAIVHGEFDHEKGKIDVPIGRMPENRLKQAVLPNGREAITYFEVVERFEGYTLLRCRLETGRTHQIRVHMKYINHPVAGDTLYGPKNTILGTGQYLHAKTLGFIHPRTNEVMEFSSDIPEDFKQTLEKLRNKNK